MPVRSRYVSPFWYCVFAGGVVIAMLTRFFSVLPLPGQAMSEKTLIAKSVKSAFFIGYFSILNVVFQESAPCPPKLLLLFYTIHSILSFMGLIDIWIPYAIIFFFLAIHVLRPLFKRLRSLEGLAWFPLIALGIAIGIFPAYGIRLECIPMLIFTVFLNLANIRPFVLTVKSRPTDLFYEKNIFLTLFSFVILTIVIVPMFVFSPKNFDSVDYDPASVKTIKLTDIKINRNYYLKIYGTNQEEQSDRPVIFIVPPDIGSNASIDLICYGLFERGFTVITYSREGYDSPLTTDNRTKHFSSFGRLFSYWKTYLKNFDPDIPNEQGISMEKDRREDIEFLLLRLEDYLTDANLPLLLVGYGAGGSALNYISGENGFVSMYNNVLGIIAIESRLWTVQSDNYIENRTQHPAMFLVSGKAPELKKESPYQAVFDKFNSNLGPIAIAAIESAGPFDYQDFPFTNPVYSFLFPGKKDVKKSNNPVTDTAGLICNFASFLLDRNGYEALPRQEIDGSLYVESKGLPGLLLQN